MKRGMATLCVVGLLVSGCSSSGSAADHSERVSSNGMGKKWPLKVNNGTLHCDGSGGVGDVTITVGGTTYALNGAAKSHTNAKDIRPIWANDAHLGFGLKKDIGPLIQRGLRLCQ